MAGPATYISWDAILEAPHCERIYAGHLRERYAQDPDLKIWQSNKVCRIINVEDLETRDEIRIQARSVGGNKVSHVAIRGADIVYIIHYVRDRLLVYGFWPTKSGDSYDSQMWVMGGMTSVVNVPERTAVGIADVLREAGNLEVGGNFRRVVIQIKAFSLPDARNVVELENVYHRAVDRSIE